MLQIKRYTFNEVKEIIESNSNCKLLSNEYKNSSTKLKLLCKCGNEFEATFEKFLRRNKRQCNECGKLNGATSRRLSIDEVREFVESNSDCKLLSNEYVDAHSKLLMMCSCGNEFLVPFKHFKNNSQRQCQQCGRNIQADKRKLDYKYIKNYIESESKSGCKLLSNQYKNSNTKIRIQCSCGNEFRTLFDMFRRYDVRSCKICRQNNNTRSKGELKIEDWLISNNISYIPEYTFETLKSSKKLRFDFAILNKDNDIKLLIEFDGKQHFGIGNFSSDEEEMNLQYEKIIKNDLLKNEFCFDKGYSLLRIPYNQYPNINDILSRSLL